MIIVTRITWLLITLFFSLPMDESVDYMPLLFLSLLYLIREWSIQMEQQKNFSQFLSGPSVRMSLGKNEHGQLSN